MNTVSGETPRKSFHRLPLVQCPVCAERGYARTSEEITPEVRYIYYGCSNLLCGMTWRSMLTVEKVISPSGISADFRPATMKPGKPPGHEFGQKLPLLTYLEGLEPAPG